MFEFGNLFGKKEKKEEPVPFDEEKIREMEAHAEEYEKEGGKAEFHTTDLSAEEQRHREARARDPWNSQESGRDAAVFNRENNVTGGYAPIDYEPTKPEAEPEEEERKSA